MKLTALALIIAGILLLEGSAYGQSVGVKGGMNLSTLAMKNNYYRTFSGISLRTGYHIGVTGDYPLNEFLWLESGLFLSNRGYKNRDRLPSSQLNARDPEINLFYLDIPVLAKIPFAVGNTKMYGQAGGYLGIGLYGDTNYSTFTSETILSSNRDIQWGSANDLKRLDYGLQVGLGVEIKAFHVGAFYSFGLANMSVNNENDFSMHNRNISVSLGYRIIKK